MGPLKGLPSAGTCVKDVRLMIEATEKGGTSWGNMRKRLDFPVTSIKDKPPALLCEGSHAVALLLIGNVPGCQGAMTKHTACIIPHGWHFGAGVGRTPPRARQGLVQTVWPCNTSTVGEIHLGKAGKEPSITHFCEGLDFRKRLADHVLKKGRGAFVPALMHRFRRSLHRRPPVRDLRRPWCQRRMGLTLVPKGHEGQQEFASTRRRALDKTGATCRAFDVCRGKEVGEHGQSTGRIRSHRSLLTGKG